MTAAPKPIHAPLPYGVRDLFYEDAAGLASLGDTCRQVFSRWGYSQVITPTYEHYDVLLRGYGADQESDLYRVLDREGAVLALRPDITTQVARLAGTKLAGEPRPLRFGYFTNVFRYDEPQAGRQREFFQAGVELIGAPTAQADAEVIEVCVECLLAAGLHDFQLNLGHMGIFRGLVAGLGLRAGQVVSLRRAIDRKDTASLARLLDEAGVQAGAAAFLQALPSLCGGPEMLDQAAVLTAALPDAEAPAGGAPVSAAVERLRQLLALLQAHGVAQHVILDLGEVRGMGYYTGINFEGFVPGLAFPICSGGRYDNLVGLYGAPSPAVGFALGVERVQMALERRGCPPPSVAPDLLVSAVAAEKSRDAIAAARAAGMRVAVDPLLAEDGELLEYARGRGIRLVLVDGGELATLWEAGRHRHLPWNGLREALRS